jgi:flagellar biosynthesis protein FlhA
MVPALLSAGQVHRVLQQLLGEGRSIRDLETILEALGDQAATTRDINALTDHVRQRLERHETRLRHDTTLAGVA